MTRSSVLDRGVALAARHPAQFTLQYPPSRRFFKSLYKITEPSLMTPFPFYKHLFTSGNESMLLYVHVPFCEHKCTYCNFAVDVRPHEQRRRIAKLYVDMLSNHYLEKLDHVLHPEVRVPGIDIGGGTPTLLEDNLLEKLMKAIKVFYDKRKAPHISASWRTPGFTNGEIMSDEEDWSISIESTPFIAANFPNKLRILRENGVGRISIGLQSTSQGLLDDVNRHKEALDMQTKAMANIKDAGFSRVHLDLIFGLPKQSLEQWKQDLNCAIDLAPDSITTYDCLYRGAGRSFNHSSKLQSSIPTPEQYAKLYDLAYEMLVENGYHAPYGAVNFSKRKHETGTSRYFQGRLLEGLPYLGLGNYASSLYANIWLFAPYTVEEWLLRSSPQCLDLSDRLLHPVGDAYLLPKEELVAKYILLSLSFGIIDKERLMQIYSCDTSGIEKLNAALEYGVQKGWLIPKEQTFLLSRSSSAFEVLPKVRSLFYSKASIKWLEEKIHQSRSTALEKKIDSLYL